MQKDIHIILQPKNCFDHLIGVNDIYIFKIGLDFCFY